MSKKDLDLSDNRDDYFNTVNEQHEINSQPREYHCPHHNKTYYLRTPTLMDEERYGNEKKYNSQAKQIAARVAILLVDSDGKQLLRESDVPRLMKSAGFVKHALDMLVALGDTDPDEYSEEEINNEKKESSETQFIDS